MTTLKPASKQVGSSLLIFGATGATGRKVTERALELGHRVTAFVRTPAKLGLEHEH